MGLGPQSTTFSLDQMGRFLCNTLQEAKASAETTVAGKSRRFDAIVIGGGTFGAVIAARLFLADTTRSRRILVLEAGPFTLPEHVQNLPFQGGAPDLRVPWDAHPGLGYAGLLFTVGGRSLTWGGWSPELLEEELSQWPESVRAELTARYFREASEQLGVTDTNDFIFGPLQVALRKQLFEGLKAGNVAHAVALAALPDHPAVRYAEVRLGAAAAAGASVGGGTATATAVPDSRVRGLLGLDASDPTPRGDLLDLLKLEAPLAVQAQTTAGLFPFNKFSATPLLTRASRDASKEAGGVGLPPDARKRLMVVPRCRVLDVLTETQQDGWVRVTGVRAQDSSGAVEEILLPPPRDDGQQGVAIIALGTIESTRLALNTFKDSLAGRASQRMGRNLMAHLRSNLNIRIPVGALKFLPAADRKALQTSALFVKGKAVVGGTDRYFHLQITASGLGKLGEDSEAELFKKVPDIEHLGEMLNASDTHVVITIRGIGEMQPRNPDSFVRLSPTVLESGRPAAEVSLADVKTPTSTTPQSKIDKQVWNAMDALADEVAVVFANKKPFEILAGGQSIPVPANATAADLKTLLPYKLRRDKLGSTHHDAGTLWMGTSATDSVTNDYGRIHDTTNCYVASPAVFPTVGSPNPMLTGVALARRTADLLTTSVLPRPALRAPDSGFGALFDGTAATFRRWKVAGPGGQSFALLDGELVSYGTSGAAVLYYAAQAFADFQLRLQFKIFDAGNHNSGVFVRFRDPARRLPPVLLDRAEADGEDLALNPALAAIYSGFEVQIDDNARGDPRRDFYGERPEADGKFKNRTGAIYKIPAGDFIFHLGRHDEALQDYVPGPSLIPGVWFQYDIEVRGDNYQVTLANTETGESRVTTTFTNTDPERGLAQIDGQPAGYVGIQSYPGSTVAFRDVWIR
jgi:choline dehydrogenase-like flavoprotein